MKRVHTEDRKVLDTIVQTSVAMVTWHLVYVHPGSKPMMKVASSFETSVHFYSNVRCHIPPSWEPQILRYKPVLQNVTYLSVYLVGCDEDTVPGSTWDT